MAIVIYRAKEIEEAAAVAFLACPERLIWNGQGRDGAGSFLGEPLVDCLAQGYFVAALLRSSFKGLLCTLSLPVTRWVVSQSKILLPERTAKLLSDSTFTEFRAACCLALRNVSYDVKLWHCCPGAQESEFAVSIMLSPKVDLCIVVPNGNKLSRHKLMREPQWLPDVCREISTAMHHTSSHGVAFVGDASLSPGLEQADLYKYLVPMLQSRLRECGVPLVTTAPGVKLAIDDVHWCVSSQEEVQGVIRSLVKQALPTSDFHCASPPCLWGWQYNSTFQRHYPTCIACNRECTDKHLESNRHLENAHGTWLSFDFPDRLKHLNMGVEFLEPF